MINVSVGIIYNQQKQLLIARRADTAPQGGLWEFPGGKVDVGETARQALVRELQEEVGIQVLEARLLLTFYYTYAEQVTLDFSVWCVDRFQGVPYGREGQPLRWVSLAELSTYPVPPASQSIIVALEAEAEDIGKSPADKDQPSWRIIHRGAQISI